MLPFIGPMITGTPKPYMNDGSLGDTGIGWCTILMPISVTKRRAARRWESCVSARSTNAVVRCRKRGSRCVPMRQTNRCHLVSSMKYNRSFS